MYWKKAWISVSVLYILTNMDTNMMHKIKSPICKLLGNINCKPRQIAFNLDRSCNYSIISHKKVDRMLFNKLLFWEVGLD